MKRFIAAGLLVFGLAWGLPAQAQWAPEETVVLKGRVVSMHKRVARGQVVVRDGMIVDVLSWSAPTPAGALVIETKGYIYPGLINLHNHPKYNFLPLYPLPKHTTNSHQWNKGKTYKTLVNNPARVLTSDKLLDRMDEVIKYAEVKAIVGGETSMQGAPDLESIRSTLVRNVELENFGEDLVDARTLVIDPGFFKILGSQKAKIKAQRAWIYHLAEGNDDYARRQWSFPGFDLTKPLSTAKSKWNVPGVVESDLVFPGLVGVHCMGLHAEDFEQWRALSGERPKMVWSPTSNLLLYGATTDMQLAKEARALIALGTDWSPSGTKNLLWELKTADRLNRSAEKRFFRTDRQLIETVTTNPAKILGWDDKVGQIRPGFHADLLVVDRLSRSGYRSLVLAREEHVQLVLVGGNPLYGDESVMSKLKVYNDEPHYERLPNGPADRPKVIDMLEDPNVPKGDMTLADVRESLLEGLTFDPTLLADAVNTGAEDENGETEWPGLEDMKAYLVKYLEKKGEPVPDHLLDPDSGIDVDDAALYLQAKFPHLQPMTELDPIFTDDRFLTDVESNLHWKAPHDVELDLRRFWPDAPVFGADGDGSGIIDGLTPGQ